MDNDKISALERSLSAMQEQGAKTNDTINLLANRLAILSSEKPHPHTPPRSARALSEPLPEQPTSRAAPSKSALKPSLPADFDGNRANGKAFLMSCRIYIRLRPDAFDSEDQQIVWAMSYMNAGRAARWVERMFRVEENAGTLPFMDWEDFVDEFKKDFTPLHSAATAINTLEGVSYFQGSRSVDDYLDDFRDLVYESGYTDPKTVVVKFRRGLDRTLSSAIATMAAGRPADDDPNTWYELAARLDQDRATNEAFLASYRAPTPRAADARPPRATQSGLTSEELPLSPRAAVPKAVDVRLMNASQLQAALKDKRAEINVARAPQELLLNPAEPVTKAKDFVSRSG
jgi:hypothetical protein